MREWTIRRARPEDAGAIARCIEDAYSVHAERITDLPAVSEGIADDIAANHVWVGEGESGIAGALVLVMHSGHAVLANVAVARAAAGGGLGKRLLAHAEAECARASLTALYLSTHAAIPENISLYIRLGWVETARSGNRVEMAKTIG